MTHSDSPALLDGLKLINWCSILPETRCDPPKFPRLAEMDGSYELWIFRPMYPMFGVLHFHEKSWILNGFFLSNSSDLEWMNDWMDHLHSGKIIISNLPPEVGPLKKHPHGYIHIIRRCPIIIPIDGSKGAGWPSLFVKPKRLWPFSFGKRYVKKELSKWYPQISRWYFLVSILWIQTPPQIAHPLSYHIMPQTLPKKERVDL